MADPGNPWWYSGSEDDSPQTPPNKQSGQSRDDEQRDQSRDDEQSTIDWTGMIAGAARMVDWARGAVLDPHAEHADPAAHPDCLICRTLVVVSDQVGMSPAGDVRSGGPDREDGPEPAPIRWITLRDGR